LIRPTAAKADLRPFQNSARSASSAAMRISNAPLSRQNASTSSNWWATSAAGPSSSTMSTAPAPPGYPQWTAASAASIASASIISIAAGMTPAPMIADTAAPAWSVCGKAASRVRTPEAVRTLLAAFPHTDQAGAAVSAIIGAGVIPAAIEMMDALAIEAAEAAVHCGYPGGAGAVLIVELDGPAAEVAHQFDEVEAFCRDNGAFEIRIAADDAERALFWKGRKSAFAAVGRISPDYIVQDGVIPRTALPEVLRRIAAISDEAGVRVANVFHAGDGNLHPLVLFDAAVPGQSHRAEQVSGAIVDLCIEYGGSITGEHGVGSDKAKYMPRMFSDDDLDTMQLVRCAFDPSSISNPGKIFPTPRLCGEVPGRHKGAHPLADAGLAEVF